MVRVLVADDSAFMRRMLSRLLGEAPGLEVVGTARNGFEAVEMTCALRPDVVTLDVEMPGMDGLAALRRLMAVCPTPVVMVSSLTAAQTETTVAALAAGAVDFVHKPSGSISLDIERVRDELVAKVQVAARATLRKVVQPVRAPEPTHRLRNAAEQRKLLVVGSSTGGPQALHYLIPALPADLPAAVVVVQHMPPGFTRSLAERLNRDAALEVREAVADDELVPGLVLVAPGGNHLIVRGDGRVGLDLGPPRHGVRPAIDVTLESAVQAFAARTVVAILTGMGFDGARGAQLVRAAGGYVLAEAAESCVIYGMPRAVVEMGCAHRVAPLEELPTIIVAALSSREVHVS